MSGTAILVSGIAIPLSGMAIPPSGMAIPLSGMAIPLSGTAHCGSGSVSGAISAAFLSRVTPAPRAGAVEVSAVLDQLAVDHLVDQRGRELERSCRCEPSRAFLALEALVELKSLSLLSGNSRVD